MVGGILLFASVNVLKAVYQPKVKFIQMNLTQ